MGVGLVVIAVGIVLLGLRIGQEVTRRPETLQLAAAGPLQAVYLANGTAYLGAIVADDGTYLRLAGGAVIRSRAQPSASSSVLEIQLLASAPFNLDGDVLVPKAQVALIANVVVGSEVANAYIQAAGAAPAPSPAASPSP